MITLFSEPFLVEFVETTYTVNESVGAVNVCVNLTLPMIDILDERLNVFVIDNSSSAYIPPGAPLAYKSSHSQSMVVIGIANVLQHHCHKLLNFNRYPPLSLPPSSHCRYT